ncbi:GtrA family protein [Pradoshia sp. D12]|uniref:GtrA family protein n=1 Tax=Bacillaceae TaxID=186817 RepID=UPI00080AFCCB|nr:MULTISPECIES: GtrA family protein [Bacillaceae]OCA90149.1 polysaccharide biosynthesis protein [Bacillus sp. FJAT-27986]QFK70444.1 GtrA family protein [Pradoshia sp. D12]TPF72239.1 GtrA family protein [Bacillus sp. D12]
MILFEKEFWKFNMVGIVNTINYYILYLLFKEVFQMNYMTAHLLGFFISMIGSFYLNSYFTYRTKPTLKKFLQFPLTYVVNILVSTLAIYILVQLLSIHDNIAPIIATIIAIPFTFLLSKMILAKD